MFLAALGLTVIVSWCLHWQRVLQLLPNAAPMQYNTALGLILLGAGLILLTTRHQHQAEWLGGAGAMLGLFTLLEYFTEWNLGIDQMFFHPYFEAETAFPGRMSPLSAMCFVLSGTALVLASSKRPGALKLTGAAVLGCAAGVVALVAFCGFVFGIKAAYGWGSSSKMAMNAAIGFLVFGGGLLAWILKAAEGERASLRRWLPGPASVTLMAMVAFVSAMNTVDLRGATYWREHTLQVIFRAQAFADNLIDLQRGVLGYVTLGETNSLAAYQRSLALAPKQLAELVELTKDNQDQHHRLKEVALAMEEVRLRDEGVIALYHEQGAAAVATGERRKASAEAQASIQSFLQEEQALLKTRGALEQAGSRNASRLLIFGSMLAAVLLALANYMISREMSRRQRMEVEHQKLIAELRRLLAEVKTLSGMIPICGWCKNIRSDEGYWQTLEQYIHQHSEATFTHGICPACTEKLKAEQQEQQTQ